MATKRLKRPRDPIALAKLIGDIATGQVTDRADDDKPKVSPMEAGRLGGLKGGAARARTLTPERRKQTTRVTPAMAAGVTQTLWSVADIVRVVDEWEANQLAR